MAGRKFSASRHREAFARFSLFLTFLWTLSPLTSFAQVGADPDETLIPPALNATEAPLPDLTGIVANNTAALILGKALFWDMQLGSDSLACASCHFHAGADNRVKNQLSPSLLRVNNPSRAAQPDTTFGNAQGQTPSRKVAAPNYQLTAYDFPFRRFADMEDRNSALVYETNDVVSSQGSFGGFLLETDPDPARFPDFCGGNDTTFEVSGVPVRKVEPRNTPTVINAVFNHLNFRDGRANNIFNGVTPFGNATANARVVVFNATSELDLEVMALDNASLASQAVGPPLNAFEMACSGRTFKDLGRGMLDLIPLGEQNIDAGDSVLGAASGLRNANGTGLNTTYRELIRVAFDQRYWGGEGQGNFIVTDEEPLEIIEPDDSGVGYTQMEHNFPMFFGIAIMLYEATLVSDQTPYDAFVRANPDLQNATVEEVEEENEGQPLANATVTFVPGFGQRELLGLDVFMNKGQCIACHSGPEFTSATVRQRGGPNGELIEFMAAETVNGALVPYDLGFYNIGVRPSAEDLGIGGNNPAGPLSITRQIQLAQDPSNPLTPFITPTTRIAVDGAFKTPTLRNVELTGPYMHNGGLSTLRQVVEFYDRGSDSRNVTGIDSCDPFGGADESGFGNASANGAQCSNLHPAIVPLALTEAEIDALIAFMIALTDPRVKNESAPFDHPDLPVQNGHQGDQLSVATVEVNATDGFDDGVRAKDLYLVLPAVGVSGRQAQNLPLLDTFLSLDPFSLGLPVVIVPQILPLLLDN